MIYFESVDRELPPLDYVSNWFEEICTQEDFDLGELSIVFGSDEWLLEQNINFLQHDFYTDIITFDYCENKLISGDILISLDRVNDNANRFNVSRETELNRVLVHGLLHLCGYSDKMDSNQKIMRKKQDYYLSLL